MIDVKKVKFHFEYLKEKNEKRSKALAQIKLHQVQLHSMLKSEEGKHRENQH